MLEKIKNHPIVSTAISLTTVYGVVAAIYLCLDNSYHQNLQSQIDNNKDYRDKYDKLQEKFDKVQEERHEAILKLNTLELNNNALLNDFIRIKKECDELKTQENKFISQNTEYISLKEELKLIELRKTNEISDLGKQNTDLYNKNIELNKRLNNCIYPTPQHATDTYKAFDQLLKDKDTLSSENRKLFQDLTEKQQEILTLQDKLKIKEKVIASLEKAMRGNGMESKSSSDVDVLIASVGDISYGGDAKLAIIAGVKMINGGISSHDFLRIYSAAKIAYGADAVETLKQCSKYINTPFTAEDANKFLKRIAYSGDHAVAAALIMMINKSTREANGDSRSK